MNKRQQRLLDTAKNHPLRRVILQNKWKDHETIAQRLNIDRQDAKRHLTILKRCGLVEYRKDVIISQRVYINIFAYKKEQSLLWKIQLHLEYLRGNIFLPTS